MVPGQKQHIAQYSDDLFLVIICCKSPCNINFNFNLFIKQKDRSATYIDMHEIHVEKL